MLLGLTVPPGLALVLDPLRRCFTAPSFRTFTALVVGLVAMPARRSVVGMLTGAGLAGWWHHSRAHWFFAGARWNTGQVGLALLNVIVAGLVPPGAAIVIAVDDTLFRRTGRKVHATAWCYDGSVRTPPGVPRLGFGNCFVIAAVVIDLPFRSRPMCLPIMARLWRRDAPGTGRHNRRAPAGAGKATKGALARQMINMIAAAIPDRQIHVVADAGYATGDWRALPATVSVTTRARRNASFAQIPPPSAPGKPGRPLLYGTKLTLRDVSAHPRPATARCYGRTLTLTITDTLCRWRGVFGPQHLRVITVTDTTTNQALALTTTDLTATATQIIERYASRWAIEVAFTDAKTHTGVGEARNRTRNAVERTVPFGLYTVSIVITWYALHGHHPNDVADRRAQAPWYRTKTEPTYQDMIVKLRRTLILHRFHATSPHQHIPPETLDALAACPDLAA